MSEPIVVGYDGTEGAKAALGEAVRLAAALDAEIVVAFAYRASGIGGETSDYLASLRERGEAVTGEAVETARAAGVAARGEMVNDDPAEGLADLAKAEGAQLIAL